MKTLDQLQSMIAEALQQLPLDKQPLELYEPFRYILDLGGKRLRPALVLMGTEMFGGKAEDALAASVAIEIFHNFSLVHDDIMDKAPLRRNQPTVHTKWNDNIAILSGDVMLVYAYQELLKLPQQHLASCIRIFNETAIGVCEGQQMDMNFEHRSDVSIAEYLEMISLKTSVLLGGALQIGSVLGGANEPQSEHMYAFGKNLGIAFQLKDDILDVFGDPAKVGKQPGGDIIAKKKTYLLLKAYELADIELTHKLNQLLDLPTSKNTEKVAGVTAIFEHLGVEKLANAESESYYRKALVSLDKVGLPADKVLLLKGFAAGLMAREF